MHYDIQKWEGMLHLSLVHTEMVEIISLKENKFTLNLPHSHKIKNNITQINESTSDESLGLRREKCFEIIYS